MIFHQRYAGMLDKICGDASSRYNDSLLSVMVEFSEPILEQYDRYNPNLTRNTTAFDLALEKFNNMMKSDFHIGTRQNIFDNRPDTKSLSVQPVFYIFSIIELQYMELSDDEAVDFAKKINKVFAENDLPWLLSDGIIIKVDAQQFECDLKAKALAQMKELKEAEPKFQSAYTELTTALEVLEKDDYLSAISNAGKSYESVLKVVLSTDNGNADLLVKQYVERLLIIPDTMKKEGFKDRVLMSLPYLRNNSGADHGAGSKEVVISKHMAKLAVNLAAALDTYLIEEYAARMTEAES